jgi:DNA repair protein RadC
VGAFSLSPFNKEIVMFIPNLSQVFSVFQFNSEKLINNALKYLEKRLHLGTVEFINYETAKSYLRLQLSTECNETFAVIFLNNRNRLLAFEKLFLGTINEIAIYPRIIVQRALAHNAAALILSHNHPSGCIDSSVNDKMVMQKISYLLGIIDIKVFDHSIVSAQDSFSFAENRLI